MVKKPDAATFLCVSDLDGTLLNPGAHLSERSRDVLFNLPQHIHFTSASARPYASMKAIFKALPLALPLISLNGACITDIKNDEVIDAIGLEISDVAYIWQCLLEHELNPVIYFQDKTEKLMHFGTDNQALSWYVEEKKEQCPQIVMLGDKQQIENDFPQHVLNFTFFTPSCPSDYSFYQVLQAIPSIRIVTTALVYHPGWWEIAIQHRDAHKGAALKKLLAYLKHHYYAISFGDGLNDIEMFQASDYACAMNNASDSVKAAATTILPHSNAEDGVAEFIYNLTCTYSS